MIIKRTNRMSHGLQIDTAGSLTEEPNEQEADFLNPFHICKGSIDTSPSFLKIL